MGKKLTLRVDGKEVTKDGLKERFDRYNKLYFWGKLGKCDFFGWQQDLVFVANMRKKGE